MSTIAPMLEEIKKLRGGGVTQEALDACALMLQRVKDLPIQQAIGLLDQFAREKLMNQAPLVQALVQHVNNMRVPTDFPKLCQYFWRVALTSALLGAAATASERLRQGQGVPEHE